VADPASSPGALREPDYRLAVGMREPSANAGFAAGRSNKYTITLYWFRDPGTRGARCAYSAAKLRMGDRAGAPSLKRSRQLWITT
jgi:hypothetical protein